MKSSIVLILVLSSIFIFSETSSPLRKGKISNTPFYLSSLDEINSQNFPDIVQSFDYPNAQIADVVKAMSVLTGVNFIIDPAIKGTISIIAPSPITVAEAFQAFLSALSINGFSIVRSGAFWKIVSAERASRGNVHLYTNSSTFPKQDYFITKVFKLQNTSVKDLEVHIKQFLTDKQHKAVFYEKANTIIISDYGSTIEKLSKIIKELDVPDVNKIVEVIPIKYAPAIDIAHKLQILIDDDSSSTPSSRTRRRTARSTRTGSVDNIINISSPSSGISAIIPDERTNSIVISGSKKGIQKVKNLIKRLDFYINPQIAGGIFVYYVKHGKAEEINQTLNNILYPQNTPTARGNNNNNNIFIPPRSLLNTSTPGYDLSHVVISHDKSTNSLIITASRHEYETLKGILDKIDIPKNQVFIKTIIMNLSAEDGLDWNISAFKFLDTEAEGLNAFIPRIGFSSRSVGSLLSGGGLSSGDSGEGILSFGTGSSTRLSLPNNLLGLPSTISTQSGLGETSTTTQSAMQEVEIPSLLSLVNIIKKQTGANILSTPQLIAIDNEESSISVGVNAPVNQTTAFQGVQATQVTSVERQDINTTLKITPYINPDGNSVRLIVEQKIDSITPTQIGADIPNAISITKREIKTNVILNDEETAVIGGLVTDDETEVIQKIPILGDIPIIGWLFRGKEVSKVKNNLVVFITPKIIRTSQDYKNILQDRLDERMSFIKKHIGNKTSTQEFIDETLSISQNSKKWAKSQKKSVKQTNSEQIETPNIKDDENQPQIIYNREK